MKVKGILSVLIILALLTSCSNKPVSSNSSSATQEITAVTEESNNENAIDDAAPYNKYEYKQYKYDTIPFSMINYKSFKIDEMDTTVSDLELNEYIQTILSKDGSVEKIVTGDTKENDTINVSYKAYIDDKEYSGFSADNKNMKITHTNLNEAFYTAIVNKPVQSEIIFNMTVPDNYSDKNICNKKMAIHLIVNYIHGAVTAQVLTEEYVRANTKFKSIKEFKTELRKKIEETNTREKINSKASLYYKAITESVKYDSSEKLNTLKDAYTLILKKTNITDNADEYIKGYLAANAIIQAENIKIGEDEKEKCLNDFAKDNGFKSIEEVYSSFNDIDKNILNNFILSQNFLPEKIMEQLFGYKILNG